MKTFGLPFQRHSDTSREAAQSMRQVAPTQQERVYQAISGSVIGLTAEEVSTLTGLSGNSVRPRIVELVSQERIRTAGKRKTRSGRSADIWVRAR